MIAGLETRNSPNHCAAGLCCLNYAYDTTDSTATPVTSRGKGTTPPGEATKQDSVPVHLTNAPVGLNPFGLTFVP